MPVVIEKKDAVTEIALDWPDVRNAIGPAEARELRLAIDAANCDETNRAIVLSAKGKAFCAGGNLPEIVRLAEQGRAAVEATIYGEFQALFRAIADCPVPLITAVDGPAVGFGCDLALASDMTFIGPRGWLAQGWINAGLIPATGGTLYVMRRGGVQAVWRLLASDRVGAAEAENLRLAIAAPDARQAALTTATKFASLPTQQLRAVKALSSIDQMDDHLSAALNYQVSFITSPTFAERARQILG